METAMEGKWLSNHPSATPILAFILSKENARSSYLIDYFIGVKIKAYERREQSLPLTAE
jgi:hypothetical protein